jgi:S-adenosylhomocysteine hydrolase
MKRDSRLSSRIFETAPLVEMLVQAHSQGRLPLEDVAIVSVQHLLETTGTLFEALVALGLKPENTFITGKIYSTNSTVAQRLQRLGFHLQSSGLPTNRGHYKATLDHDVARMWSEAHAHISARAIRKVLVLDDGGCALSNIPQSILADVPAVGVEQTMSGISLQAAGQVTIPVVEVATSAAKRLIEPILIQKAVFRRLSRVLASRGSDQRYGVIGYGNIGKAVIDALLALKRKVSIFDSSDSAREAAQALGIPVFAKLQPLLDNSDVIFGCTGADVFAVDTCWKTLSGCKTLASCSSLDTEFRSILASFNSNTSIDCSSVLRDITLELPKGRLEILAGGFPINFDQSPESVPLGEIQLTRALLLAGLLQAAALDESYSGFREIPLSAGPQQFIVSNWLSLKEECRNWYSTETLSVFDSEHLVQKHSRLDYQIPLPAALA